MRKDQALNTLAHYLLAIANSDVSEIALNLSFSTFINQNVPRFSGSDENCRILSTRARFTLTNFQNLMKFRLDDGYLASQSLENVLESNGKYA